MKVIAQTAALQEALTVTGSIIASRTPKPVLQCIKLVAKDKTLTLLATDLEAGCRYSLTAVQIEEEGEALIPAARLAGIVREAAGESLTIETDKDAAHVRGAGSYFKIFGFDPAEYPPVEDFGDKADFEISAAALSQMIARTLFAAAKAHSHYAISGVLWEASDKKLQLVATDGHRLAQAKSTLAQPTEKALTAIVPAKLMALITRVCDEADETARVRVAETKILVQSARAVLVSSLVQGNFPKYEDVIPKDCGRRATVNTAEFEHRVRQAALLTNEESRGVRLSFQGDKITLTSRAPEAGEAEVTCGVAYDGEPMDIAFNPAFLLDALRVVDSDEIVLEISAANKPAMMKAGSDFLYVLMPVDLN